MLCRLSRAGLFGRTMVGCLTMIIFITPAPLFLPGTSSQPTCMPAVCGSTKGGDGTGIRGGGHHARASASTPVIFWCALAGAPRSSMTGHRGL